MLVKDELADRVKVVAKSSAISLDHCLFLDEELHKFSIAAATVKPVIGTQQYNAAWRCPRAAGCAKHDWSDVINGEINDQPCVVTGPNYDNDYWIPSHASSTRCWKFRNLLVVATDTEGFRTY